MARLNCMDMNKKGLFFTFIAISILTLMFLSIMGGYSVRNYHGEVVKAQYDVLDSHNSNLKSYARNLLFVQSKKAFTDLLSYTESSGPIDNVTLRFEELVMNATLFDSSVNAPSMDNRGFRDWTLTMDEKAEEFLLLESNMDIVDPRPVQHSPWRVTIYADVVINTSKGNLSYDARETVNITLSILGWNDPLYYHNNLENIINITSVFDFDQVSTFEMLEQRTYRHNHYAPNFLQRLENSTSSSNCCGIESLVHAGEDYFNITSMYQYNRSYVDHLFWSKNRSCEVGDQPLFTFNYISNQEEAIGFKLDSVYMSIYGMNETDAIEQIC